MLPRVTIVIRRSTPISSVLLTVDLIETATPRGSLIISLYLGRHRTHPNGQGLISPVIRGSLHDRITRILLILGRNPTLPAPDGPRQMLTNQSSG